MLADQQTVLLCDETGKFTGEYIPKMVGHSGAGKRHLAITVLLENSKGEVLLQRRKHKIFDDIWDLTGATHPLHLQDHDESFEEATERCLQREYSIPKNRVKLKNLGIFNYFAQYKDGLCENQQAVFCENEHCALLVGEYNGLLKLNDKVGYGYKWMKKEDFLQDIKKNPTNYSPWAVEGVKLLDYGSN